jgi:hypothetical protein
LSSSSILLYQFFQPAIGGQGPVFEGILPFMGLRQSCFERDSLRLGFNEFKRVRGSHGPEVVGWWLVLDGNQNLSG